MRGDQDASVTIAETSTEPPARANRCARARTADSGRLEPSLPCRTTGANPPTRSSSYSASSRAQLGTVGGEKPVAPCLRRLQADGMHLGEHVAGRELMTPRRDSQTPHEMGAPASLPARSLVALRSRSRLAIGHPWT